jgi:hypothetical protein
MECGRLADVPNEIESAVSSNLFLESAQIEKYNDYFYSKVS